MNRTLGLFALSLPLLSGGCVRTVADIVTLPVKAASRGVDVLTTSQSESDEKRGRAMREREERLGKLARQRDRADARCQDGDRDACGEAETLRDRIADLDGSR